MDHRDKHKIEEGEHYNISTQNEKILSEDTANDPGWTQTNDQISGCGLTLVYHLDKDQQVLTPIYDEDWSLKNSKERIVQFDASINEKTTIF